MPSSPASRRSPIRTQAAAPRAPSTGRLLGSSPTAVAVAVLLLVLPPMATHAQQKEENASNRTDEEKAPVNQQAESTTSGLASIAQLIPVGHEQKSVVIPNYSDTQLSSLIRAAEMKRLDDQRLGLTEVTITTYDDQEAEEMVVNMPTAIYHLETSILEGTSRSSVSRADFDILGDGMLFDSSNNFGRMEGNVHMTIKDSSAFQFESEPTKQNQPAETTQP